MGIRVEIGPTVCVDTRGRTCFLSNTDNICRYFRENVTGQDARFENGGNRFCVNAFKILNYQKIIVTPPSGGVTMIF